MHKDATGREITKGAYVAYVSGTGSRASIRFGAVTKLKSKVKEQNVWDHQTKNYVPTTVTTYSLQVITASKGYVGTYPNGHEAWTVPKEEGKLARVHSIDRLDRIILLEPIQMLPEARDALDKELRDRGTI